MADTPRGILFPLAIDPVKGNLVVGLDADLIQGQILSYLQTEVYERVMVPDYGINNFLFTTIQDVFAIAAEIENGLTSYVPGVVFEVEGAINDQGEGVFLIYWTYNDVVQPTITVTI